MNQPWRDDREQTFLGILLLFGLIGKLLHEEPEQDELQELVDDDVFAGAPFAAQHPDVRAGLSALQRWSDDWRADADKTMTDLRVDWTRLFAGAGLAPISPWESIFRSEEGALFDANTLVVRAWYRQFGLELSNLHREPDDHIGLELLFIAQLARQGLSALKNEDDKGYNRTLQGMCDFSREHLLAWAPAWSERAAELSNTDFYRGLALVVRGALTELSGVLDVVQRASSESRPRKERP